MLAPTAGACGVVMQIRHRWCAAQPQFRQRHTRHTHPPVVSAWELHRFRVWGKYSWQRRHPLQAPPQVQDASRAFRDAVGGGGRVEQPGEAAAKAAQEERDRAEAEATAAEHEREQLRLWDARLKDRERQEEDA